MILPVSTLQNRNIEYFRSFNDDEVLFKFREAESIWLSLLIMGPDRPDHTDGHRTTLLFWQQNRDDLETIIKERDLVP
jgi:hypothetical protein